MLQAALSPWPQAAEQQEAQVAALPSERARNVLLRLRGTCAGWRLVLTGHSLGGGVTGLLGPLLQSKYPNLRWALGWRVAGDTGNCTDQIFGRMGMVTCTRVAAGGVCTWLGRPVTQAKVCCRRAGGGRGGRHRTA